ncbi:MAG: hypothetical protein ACLFPV_12995 [Spirochaetaceae bacterium]
MTRFPGPSPLVGGVLFFLLLSSCAGLSERESGGEGAGTPVAGVAGSEDAERPDSGQDAVLRLALAASPAETQVLQEGRYAVALAYDLDGDRREDVASLAVRAGEGRTLPSASLFRPPRPPDEGGPSYSFVLEYYLRSPGSSGDLRSVGLGNHSAARDFSVVPLHATKALPAAVSTEFYTPRGTEEVWAVFQVGEAPSLFRMAKHPNAGFEVFDIDDDQTQEVVTRQSRLEEGRGYESYLTLHQLEETGFSPVGTINVVRNLREFLGDLRTKILGGRWGSIADGGAGSPSELDGYFRPVEDTFAGGESFPFSYVADIGIDNVLLPQLLENPFGSLEARETIMLPFNVVCCEGALFSFLLGVRFRQNPFVGEQFELVPYPLD